MKRWISGLLAFLTIVSLAACSAEKKAPEETFADLTTDTGSGETEPAETEPAYVFPEADMDGWEFSLMNTDPASLGWANTTFLVDGLKGEIVNDAIFERNNDLADRYNCTLREDVHKFSTIPDELAKNVMAGDNTYTMYACSEGWLNRYLPYLADCSNIPGLKLDQVWWNPAATSVYRISGKQTALAGYMTLSAASRCFCIVYNKALWESIGGQDQELYDLVRKGEWTIGRYFELTQDVGTDLDGNGRWTEDDLYAMYFGRAFKGYLGGFLLGADVHFTTEEEGDIEFTIHKDQRAIDLLTKLIDAWLRPGFTYEISTDVNGTNTYLMLFEEGHALFTQRVPHDIIRLRDMEQDFGILPLPKYDESQKNYISVAYGGVIWTLPACYDPYLVEYLGIFLDALAYMTYKDVLPGYVETAVKTRTGRDADSGEMLDIIYNNITFDVGTNILFDGVLAGTFIKSIFDQKASNVIVSSATSVERQIKQYIDSLTALAEKLK